MKLSTLAGGLSLLLVLLLASPGVTIEPAAPTATSGPASLVSAPR